MLDEKGKLPNQIAHQGKHTFWWKGNPPFPKFDSEIKTIKLNFEITGTYRKNCVLEILLSIQRKKPKILAA